LSNCAGDGNGGRRWEGWSSCSALVAEAAAVSRATAGRITTIQADIREVELPEGQFDIVLAAVLHHLRTDQEWRDVFAAFHRALRPGLLRQAGFAQVAVLHKNVCFAAFGAVKGQRREITSPAVLAGADIRKGRKAACQFVGKTSMLASTNSCAVWGPQNWFCDSSVFKGLAAPGPAGTALASR
jgi:hypothetical protein